MTNISQISQYVGKSHYPCAKPYREGYRSAVWMSFRIFHPDMDLVAPYERDTRRNNLGRIWSEISMLVILEATGNIVSLTFSPGFLAQQAIP